MGLNEKSYQGLVHCVTLRAPNLCELPSSPSVKVSMSWYSLERQGKRSRVVRWKSNQLEVLALPPHGCAAAGKSLSFSGPQFPPPCTVKGLEGIFKRN